MKERAELDLEDAKKNKEMEKKKLDQLMDQNEEYNKKLPEMR